MPDITTIAAFITSVKNATDIAKALKDVDVSLERAETKLKIAELLSSLADAKIQAAEIQDVIQEKDKQIVLLQDALKFQGKVVRKGDAYYEMNDTDDPIGYPYCSHCWEANHLNIHLVNIMGRSYDWVCPACKNTYSRNTIRVFKNASDTEINT